jgi:hypothetical protein
MANGDPLRAEEIWNRIKPLWYFRWKVWNNEIRSAKADEIEKLKKSL